MADSGFPCTRCGSCCRHVEGLGLPTNDEGVCALFVDEELGCSIYEDRPLICRVDDYGEAHGFPRDVWYMANARACEVLQQLDGVTDKKYLVVIR